MAKLFGMDKSGISRHIKNVFETGELDEGVVVAKIATTTQYGVIAGKVQGKGVMIFNLDMIISVGYRVNSIRDTHFLIWATPQLKELMSKGFVLNNEKLRNHITTYFSFKTKQDKQLSLRYAGGFYFTTWPRCIN